MSERIIVSLGDIYASTCGICGKRAIWGIASQSGPEGCKEAVNRGETYCEKHLPGEPEPAMNKWIEELETNFKFNNHTQGDLIEYGPSGKESILYQVTSEGIYIDRVVTIPQMEALLSHMKKHQK